MGNAMAFLKKKGPLEMPMAFWVGFVAIGGYLGYRWWSNRSGSSSSSSTDASGSVSDGATTDQTIPGGEIDTTEPPTSTTPPVGEKTPTGSLGSGTTHTETGGNKTKTKHKHPKKRRQEATHHDHRQGTHHTDHKRVPAPKSRHHHAPHKKAKESSAEKAKRTDNVASMTPVTIRTGAGQGAIRGAVRNNAVPAPSPKSRVPKTLPARPKHEEEHKRKEHKAPPRKRQRVG